MLRKIISSIISMLILFSAIAFTASADGETIKFILSSNGEGSITVPGTVGAEFVVEFIIKNNESNNYSAIVTNAIKYDPEIFELVSCTPSNRCIDLGNSAGDKFVKTGTGGFEPLNSSEYTYCELTFKTLIASGIGTITSRPKDASISIYNGDVYKGVDGTIALEDLEVTIGTGYKPVTQISLNPANATLDIGETIDVTVSVNSDASNKNFTVLSQDTDVATVQKISDNTFRVTGVNKKLSVNGCTTKIIVSAADNKNAEFTVNVNGPKVTLTPSSAELYPEDTLQMQATILPSNRIITFKSHNKNNDSVNDIVRVSNTGLVEALKIGDAIVVAQDSFYSNINMSSEIKVKPNVITLNKSSTAVKAGSNTTISISEFGAAKIYTEANDLEFYCESSDSSKATATISGRTITINGVAEGSTTIKVWSNKFGKDVLFATCTVTVTTGGGGGGGGGGAVSTYKLTICTPDGEELKVETKTAGATVKIADYTFTKDGYTFEGLFTDKGLTKKAEDFKITAATTLYAKFVEAQVKPERPATIPPSLTDVHVAYIVGRGEGKVQPQASITRAEVATIFFRLLEDEIRDANYSKENNFTDVNAGDWFNTAVSTLTKLKILNGYDNGDGTYSFKPNNPITRAEYATIVARLAEAAGSEETKLVDISDHWAYENILKAASLGWIKGYEDSTFRPANNITRAEAMTLTNRVLCREPETIEDILSEQMTTFTDNTDTSMWYYLAIQEATNSHEYKMKADGKHETWTKLTETPDWTKLEKE